jgi:hypothetical protein
MRTWKEKESFRIISINITGNIIKILLREGKIVFGFNPRHRKNRKNHIFAYFWFKIH